MLGDDDAAAAAGEHVCALVYERESTNVEKKVSVNGTVRENDAKAGGDGNREVGVVQCVRYLHCLRTLCHPLPSCFGDHKRSSPESDDGG